MFVGQELDSSVSEYRIEYTEKGIPGTLYKYVTGMDKLLNLLLKLKYFNKLENFDNVKIYRNDHERMD